MLIQSAPRISHLEHLIEDLVKDADEDLVADRLQAGRAVISVWSADGTEWTQSV